MIGPFSKNDANPIFSEKDADLRGSNWRLDRYGYARRSIRSQWEHAHRIVLSRELGRSLNASDICDHINRDKIDNRRENIRGVTKAGNSQNRSTPNPLFRGTTWHACGKWQATVGHLGKTYYLGLFSDRISAAKASEAKRQELRFLTNHKA